MFEGFVSVTYVGVVVLCSLANVLAYADITPAFFAKSLTAFLIRFTRLVYVFVLMLLFLHWVEVLG